MDRIARARLKALGMDYAEYLKSPWWRQFREAYKSSHPVVCLACTKRTVEFHHLTYERLGRERPADVVLLCGSHHRSLHNYQKHLRKKFLTRSSILKVLHRKKPTSS